MSDIVELLENKMESGELTPFFAVSKHESVLNCGHRETKYTAIGYKGTVSESFALKDGELRIKIKRPSGHHVEILITEIEGKENQPFWED